MTVFLETGDTERLAAKTETVILNLDFSNLNHFKHESHAGLAAAE